jgi:hypothetical protein
MAKKEKLIQRSLYMTPSEYRTLQAAHAASYGTSWYEKSVLRFVAKLAVSRAQVIVHMTRRYDSCKKK